MKWILVLFIFVSLIALLFDINTYKRNQCYQIVVTFVMWTKINTRG